MHYLSRAYVEFGPFPNEELQSFLTRGLLKETDYLRAEGTEVWTHVKEWATPPPKAPPTALPTKKPARKPKLICDVPELGAAPKKRKTAS